MPVVYYGQLKSVAYGRNARDSASDSQIIKAMKLEEIAAKSKIIAARTRRAPIGAFFYGRDIPFLKGQLHGVIFLRYRQVPVKAQTPE